MERMIEIAQELSKLYPALKLLEVALSHKQQDLEGRKLYLTPVGGFEGKNPEQRSNAADRAYAEDDICKGLAVLIRENQGQIAEVSGQVQALEAERRALEWGVRGRLVDALSARHIARQDAEQNGGERVEAAFDDTAQAEWDADVFQAGVPEEALKIEVNPPAFDDLPF